jgi:type VI secretion system protein ImpE
MNAAEFFKAGKLQQAIDAQIQAVKAKPADQAARVFLFELSLFAGDLDRAQRQIDAVNYGDVQQDAGAQAYRKLLEAEKLRRRWFHEGIAPKFLTEPSEAVTLRVQACNALRGKQFDEAAGLLRRADKATPPIKGTLNGKPFELLRDCDDLFGPVLEMLAHGDYYWVPLEQIDTLTVTPPEFTRDLYFARARVEMRSGPSGDVFLPALYPDSHLHDDDQVKLGRSTDWIDSAPGPVRGAGHRTFLCDDDAISLLEWRQLQIG